MAVRTSDAVTHSSQKGNAECVVTAILAEKPTTISAAIASTSAAAPAALVGRSEVDIPSLPGALIGVAGSGWSVRMIGHASYVQHGNNHQEHQHETGEPV